MQGYGTETGPKCWKDKNCKIGFRWYGSTHSSATKRRIERIGKRRARRLASEEMEEMVPLRGVEPRFPG
jgi:hypothetical protein